MFFLLCVTQHDLEVDVDYEITVQGVSSTAKSDLITSSLRIAPEDQLLTVNIQSSASYGIVYADRPIAMRAKVTDCTEEEKGGGGRKRGGKGGGGGGEGEEEEEEEVGGGGGRGGKGKGKGRGRGQDKANKRYRVRVLLFV